MVAMRWSSMAQAVAMVSRGAGRALTRSRGSCLFLPAVKSSTFSSKAIGFLSIDGVGCSHWHAVPIRAFASRAVKDETNDEEDKIDFMEEDEVVEDEDDILSELKEDDDETRFSIDQVEDKELEELGVIPLEAKRPRLPTSIKKLNRLLGRKQMIEVPDTEIIETFVRGRGPGGQAINKINSSVSLIHIPTGIRIQSQPTRSRDKNRIAARHILSTHLDELRAQGLYTPAIPDKVKEGAALRVLSKSQKKKEEEKALSLSYSKSEIRAAKIRQRKINNTKKQKKKRREQEEEKAAAAVAQSGSDEQAGA